jgi:alpha-mannosidase
VSPDYLEVRLGAERSFLFTGGLPFLQRHGARMADVILVPEGERCRTFDLLLAPDRDVPMQTAFGWVSPAPVVATDKGPPAVGPSSWLAHLDMPNVLVTCLKPVEPGEGAGRAVAGTLVETAGFGGVADLQFARTPDRVALVDGMGNALQPLSLSEEVVRLEYSAGETFRVKAEWV